MKPHDLKEFAEELRRKGNFYEAEFADEILELLALEDEVAEPYSNLCADLETYTPHALRGHTPEKQLEWINDRANLLQDIETQLEEAGLLSGTAPNGLKFKIDADDAVRELISRAPPALEYDL